MEIQPIYEQLLAMFQQLITGLINILPKILTALLVLGIGLILARIIERLINRVILYLGNSLNAKLRNRLLAVDLKGSAKFVSKTTYWILILLVIAITTQILGLPVMNAWFNELLVYLPNILAAVIIVFAGLVIGRLLGDIMASALSRSGVTTGTQIRKLVQFVVIFIASVIAINQVGINIEFLTNLIAIIIAALLFGASLAFGLGAQTSVSNILGSYYLQKSYHEGNTVKIGEIEGVIIRITATSVHLKTKTGEVIIPAKNFNEQTTTLVKDL